MTAPLRLCAATLCALLALALPAAAFDVQSHKSPNGHSFSLLPMREAAQTVVHFVWRGGDAYLPAEKGNLPELAPVLLAQSGSTDMPITDLGTQLNAIGGGLLFYSGTDALHGLLIGVAGKMVPTAQLMNAVMARPKFDERWLKRLQRNFVENVTKDQATTGGQAWRALREAGMGNHPLKQVRSKTPAENINKITIADIKDWHRRSLSTGNLGIFAAGPATAAEIGQAIDAALQGLPAQNKRKDYAPLAMRYPGKTILLHDPKLAKSYILVAGPVPKNYAPSQEERELGMAVLGVSDQSRLHTALRTELRATYAFSAWMSEFSRDSAVLYFQGEVDTAQVAKALQTIETTYTTLRQEGISAVEFPFAKRLYANRAKTMVSQPKDAANMMAEAWLTNRSPVQGLGYAQRATALQRAAVNRVIATQFPSFDSMTKIVVSPDAKAVQADCVITHFTQAARCR